MYVLAYLDKDISGWIFPISSPAGQHGLQNTCRSSRRQIKQSRQKSQTEPDTYKQIILYILRINEAEMRGNVPDLQALLKHGQLLLFCITAPVKFFFFHLLLE